MTFIDRQDGAIGRLHVYVSIFDSNGVPVEFRHFVETVTWKSADAVVSKSVDLKKGTYRVFVTVRDELSDEVGVAVKEIGF